MNLINDIYYSKKYIFLYIKEKEELFEFEYKEEDCFFYTISIKRPILKIGNEFIDDGYYDLETAYGYGGFYTNSEDKEFLNRAILEYSEKCKKEKIIAEFVRFHPFNNFPIKFAEFLDLNIYDRDTVYLDLSQKYEELKKQYKSSLQRNIKKAIYNNLTFDLEHINNNSINKFIELYNLTMNKNFASKFYFFDKDYFDKLFKLENVELYSIKYNNQTISMIIVFNNNEKIYYHLGATNPKFYSLNPNALIFDSIIKKYNQKANFLYFGGGTSSKNDDSLLQFKQKFSHLKKPFYISGKIYNKEIYEKYLRIWEIQSKKEVKYFLKYRLDIE